MVDVGRAVEGALERVRRAVLPFGAGEEAGSRKREAADDGDGEEEAVRDEPEAVATETDSEEREDFDEGDEEEGEDEDGDDAERAVRRRARAVVLDTGRPAAPSSWRGLPAEELIRQGIADADRKRRG